MDAGNNGINTGAENFIVATIPEKLSKTSVKNPISEKRNCPRQREYFGSISIKKDVPEISVATGTTEYQAVSSQFLMEDKINLQAIALVRCVFRSQYYESSTQPWNEQIIMSAPASLFHRRGLSLPPDMFWRRRKIY